MFEVKNVSKQYNGEFALRDVSLNIGKGLNFIIGASGSGKTTLLKIISGMEEDFEGDVFYSGQNIKRINEQEKSYFYNNIFGFVWQDFNLLEDLTVVENITLPQYLKGGQDRKAVMKILGELKISQFADKKVKKLSGGQKQRVAIARELAKNPQVIIADEPTSALDEKSSKIIMGILGDISKSRTVIVVTHDTSLISSSSRAYELDKGELVTKAEDVSFKKPGIKKSSAHKLSFKDACSIAITNIKSKIGGFTAMVLSILMAATLLLLTVSGGISSSGQSAFDKLFATYGPSILDISIISSFTSASGTNGEENDKPNMDVTQDIGGMYDKYANDKRVEHILFIQPFNNIKVTVDGREYALESTNSSPYVNKLTAGRNPTGSKNEIVVPNSFTKKLGLSDKEALGKTLTFKGSMYNWESGKPVYKPVSIDTTIVGVADTTIVYDYEGKIFTNTIDDAFFFSKAALDAMRSQAGMVSPNINFYIRAKTPADMISIKDELNAQGIVPLGRFELVEDMVRLNNQTSQQSGSAIIVIGILSLVLVAAVALITSLLRKREYAIYKVTGYSKKHLSGVMGSEFLIAAALSGIMLLLLSPLINMGTTAFWSVNILNVKLLSTGVLLIIGIGALSCAITIGISAGTKAVDSLKTGER